MGAWYSWKFRGGFQKKIMGHTAFIQNEDQWREILQRYAAEPSDVFDLKINGQVSEAVIKWNK